MSHRFSYKTIHEVSDDPAGDAIGKVRDAFPDVDMLWPDGTGSNQADQFFYDERTLAGGANEDIDLKALPAMPWSAPSAINMAEIRAIWIRVTDAQPDALEVKPGAANGFLGFLKDASDILVIHQGGEMRLTNPIDGLMPVGASTKVLNFLNSHGSTALNYHILVVGTSA